MKKVVLIPILVILLMLSGCFGYEIVKMESSSMKPTIESEQSVLIQNFYYRDHNPKRGDIVLMKMQSTDEQLKNTPTASVLGKDTELKMIKRIVGLPGERVSIKDNKVYIDDQLLKEPYIRKEMPTTSSNTQIWRLRKDQVFLMGDNRYESFDSRHFGPVGIEKVVGKVVLDKK